MNEKFTPPCRYDRRYYRQVKIDEKDIKAIACLFLFGRFTNVKNNVVDFVLIINLAIQ
jgi:hypothetical protein